MLRPVFYTSAVTPKTCCFWTLCQIYKNIVDQTGCEIIKTDINTKKKFNKLRIREWRRHNNQMFNLNH